MCETFGVVRYSNFERERKKQIRLLAHQLWLMRGCPNGSPEVDWFSAEAQFDQEFVSQLELGSPA